MTKRLPAVVLAVGLVVGSLALPAEAKKKKPKPTPPPPAPVATTVYLDGETEHGEEQMANVPEARPADYLDLAKEAGGAEKSMRVPDYAIGPNATCAGNYLVPVFVGDIKGRIVGDMKITLEAEGTNGTTVDVRVWPDINEQTCTDVPEPAGSVQVAFPASRGPVEITIPALDFVAAERVMIQFTPTSGSIAAPQPPPTLGTVYYGTEEAKVEFGCFPVAGSTSCI